MAYSGAAEQRRTKKARMTLPTMRHMVKKLVYGRRWDRNVVMLKLWIVKWQLVKVKMFDDMKREQSTGAWVHTLYVFMSFRHTSSTLAS